MSNINFFRVMAGNGANFTPAQIPCNAGSISFNGSPGYYEAEAVVLGEGIGAVTCSFNAQSVPDRFRLVWSGSTVADSLIIGDSLKSTFNYNSSVTSLSGNNTLAKKDWKNNLGVFVSTGTNEIVTYTSASFPPQSSDNGPFRRDNANLQTGSFEPNGSGRSIINYIYNNPGWYNETAPNGDDTGNLENGNWGAQRGVLPNFPVFNGNNYSSSCVDGNVQLTFYKHTRFPTTFKIVVEGVPSNTAWNLFSVSCPTGATVNSSSAIMDNNAAGTAKVIYHTAPTFDLRPGMKCYYDIALTQPVSASAGSGALFGQSSLISGSLPTNPPTSGYIRDNYAFANTFLTNTGAFLVFYTGSDTDLHGMIYTASAATAVL